MTLVIYKNPTRKTKKFLKYTIKINKEQKRKEEEKGGGGIKIEYLQTEVKSY